MDEPKGKRGTKKQVPGLHCSFCDKSQYEVRKLVARGDNDQVTICDECIERCIGIINDQSLIEAEWRPKALIDYIVRQHQLIVQARSAHAFLPALRALAAGCRRPVGAIC
ncbi:ClpX C4-type zinc finger protein [Achromobacter spanius]|uniref:ClpX C4-type zinc finger protein n=1 Tax=Achromobacter spanius TaxID=217203 RepID=UPI0037F2C25F